ncbi:MAG: metallophosphoesterase family protein [Clostridia bacterium]|nr:metallophosphoesterase family protein [Clostridia bacterium]
MNLSFKNGKFKIMQIADIQEDIPLNLDTVKLIDLALEKEKPDLVVLTGDQIQGYSACYLKDSEKKAEKCIDSFLEPIVKRNIPFCFTFGNHDDDCKVNKAKQLKMYGKYESCVFGEADDRFDEGTFSLKIRDSQNKKDIFALYLLDSGKMQKNGTYAPMKQERIQWLHEQKQRNGYLPAFLFQHIPFPEYYDILEKCSPFKKGAVEAFRSRKNTYYILPGKSNENDEFMGETPGAPEINSGEFDEIKKDGDIFAVWVGHDHINSFRRSYQGVDLGYCQGAGFNTYGPGKNRGVRIFVLNEEELRNYETYTVTMGELCDFKPSKPLKEFVFTHMPSSLDKGVSIAKKAAIVGGAAGLTVAIITKIIKG